MVVIGVRFGRWGLDKYGPKPVTVDRLQFLRCVPADACHCSLGDMGGLESAA